MIDLAEHHAFAFGTRGEDFAPRVDDHGAPPGAAAAVRAALRGCDDVGLVLDGTRPQQRCAAPVGTVKAEGTNMTSNSPSPR